LRAPITAIYHFARTADDLADEGQASPEQRLADLAAYRQALHQACGEPTPAPLPSAQRWPQVFGPLAPAIADFDLPAHLLHALLDAFQHDVCMTRDSGDYPDISSLLAYCANSANPVGRLLLYLYGVQDEPSLERSDAICTALQLINFWQDPSRDLPRGRNYFPGDWCARTGFDPRSLMRQPKTSLPPSKNASLSYPNWQTPAPAGRSQTDAMRQSASTTPAGADAMVRLCARDARARMEQGQALVHRLPGRAGWELRLVVQGGLRVLDKIEDLAGAVLHTRPRLHWWDAPRIIWRALLM
jgi:phytoene/squalene synthetase